MSAYTEDELPSLILSDSGGLLRFGTLRRPELMLPPRDLVEDVETFDESEFSVGLQAPEVDDSAEDFQGGGRVVDPPRISPLKWIGLLVVGLAFLVVLVFALKGLMGGGSAAATEPVSRNIIVGVGERVPSFSGSTLKDAEDSSKLFSSGDLFGRATLLVVWSSNDENVGELLSRMARLAPSLENSSRPFQVVTLNLDASPDLVQSALSDAGAEDLLTLFDRLPGVEPSERMSARLRIVDTPWIFLIDERGSLEDADVSGAELTNFGNAIQ